jgi:hypothetical protein
MSATTEALKLEIEAIKQRLAEGKDSPEKVLELKFNLRSCQELLEKTTKVLKEGKQVLKD